MSDDLGDLLRRLEHATGSDPSLDRGIHRLTGGEGNAPDYTASIDRCVELVHRLLPGWRWHVGWDAAGVLPYASLQHEGRCFGGRAPTVPLALLTSIVRARLGTAETDASPGGPRGSP